MVVANIFGFGNGPELAIVGVVVLVLFGTSKVGTFFKSLGEGVKEFKKASKDEPEATEGPKLTVVSPVETNPVAEDKTEAGPVSSSTPATKE